MIEKIFFKIVSIIYTIHYTLKRFLYIQNFNKRHFTFGFSNGKLQITSTNHDDFITLTQEKIKKLAKTNTQKDFIKLSLTEAINGCNFIIFSDASNNHNFVQFWTGNHKFEFDFCANKVNKLRKYYYSILGLLSELGFVNKETEQNRGRFVYKIDKSKSHISISANFRKDIELAAKFTDSVFKKIYKINSNKVLAKLG